MRKRNALQNLTLVGSFTLMLTFLFYLAHDPVPNFSHRVGWQAFESIAFNSSSKGGQDVEQMLDHPTDHAGADQSVAEELSLPSFPLDAYTPLLPNAAPITAIAVESCLPLSTCSPKTTPQEDALLGKWVRVERSLDPAAQMSASVGGVLKNLFGSLEQRWIFYRKSRRYDVPLVVEIRLVEQGVHNKPKGKGWHRAKHDLRSKYLRVVGKEKNLHLYYRTVGGPEEENRRRRKEQLPDQDPITELDIVYGDNPAWPGFDIAGVITTSHPDMGAARVALSYRRKPQKREPVLPPQFRNDGKFKILQLADLHFSVTPEPCRDVKRPEDCVAKNDTLALIEYWLDQEQPDMVVFTGDQLNGQKTSWDERSVLPLYAAPIIARKLPWAAIMGNHDSEKGSISREEQMRLIQNMPYSLSMIGPATIEGAGNYYVELLSPFKDRTRIATLWFLDSGTHAPANKWKPWEKPGYGFVHKDQIDWWRTRNAKLGQLLRPYKPDGAEDLGPQWRRDTWESGADQGQTLKRAPAIMFTHIPVPEAFAPADVDAAGRQLIVGLREETATFAGAQAQPGIFDAITDEVSHAAGDVQGLGEQSVKLLVHGHMHLNEDCRRVRGVWICFGGGSSFAGYGKDSFKRRARVIEFSDWGETIKTWHRLEHEDKRTDEITLVPHEGRSA